jgi:hypothetical protein
MTRPRKVDPQALENLIKQTSLPAVGATNAHPDLFPEGFGIGRRTAPRNEYLGLVVTRPEEFTVVLGLNYRDAADDADNEDMYKLDTSTLDLEAYMRGRFEREYPGYAGHHCAAKPFLRKPPSCSS